MEPVARGHLRCLHTQSEGITVNPFFQSRALREKLRQGGCCDSESCTGGLADRPGATATKAHGHRRSDEAFPADEPNLDTFAVLQDAENRDDTAGREITEPDWRASLMQHVMDLQGNRLQLRVNQLPFI